MSQADELKKWKDLLDQGVISQDEFNKKKVEVLNSPQSFDGASKNNEDTVSKSIEKIEKHVAKRTPDIAIAVAVCFFVLVGIGLLELFL
jgi:hypothetical protein